MYIYMQNALILHILVWQLLFVSDVVDIEHWLHKLEAVKRRINSVEVRYTGI